MLNEVNEDSTNASAFSSISMDSNSGKSTRSFSNRKTTLKRSGCDAAKAITNLHWLKTRHIYHWQYTRVNTLQLIVIYFSEGCITRLNRLQFRQIWFVTCMKREHSQAQIDDSQQMLDYRSEVIWEKACLVLTHSFLEHPSNTTEYLQNCHFLSLYHRCQWIPMQVSLFSELKEKKPPLSVRSEHSGKALPPTLNDLREGMPAAYLNSSSLTSQV